MELSTWELKSFVVLVVPYNIFISKDQMNFKKKVIQVPSRTFRRKICLNNSILVEWYFKRIKIHIWTKSFKHLNTLVMVLDQS